MEATEFSRSKSFSRAVLRAVVSLFSSCQGPAPAVVNEPINQGSFEGVYLRNVDLKLRPLDYFSVVMFCLLLVPWFLVTAGGAVSPFSSSTRRR